MCPQSFLCEEAKVKQRSSSKNELCKIGEETIWESRFTCFLFPTAHSRDFYNSADLPTF